MAFRLVLKSVTLNDLERRNGHVVYVISPNSVAFRAHYVGPTRNSSGDEIANVNFLYDDIVHVLQNTIDSCINSATDRRAVMCWNACVYQIQLNNAIQRPLRRSRSFKVANFGTNQKLIRLPISNYLPPILHRFQVTADYSSNFC